MANLLTTNLETDTGLLAKALVGKGRLFQVWTETGVAFFRADGKVGAENRMRQCGQQPVRIQNVTQGALDFTLANTETEADRKWFADHFGVRWVIDATSRNSVPVVRIL